MVRQDAGRLEYRNVGLRDLILVAYDLPPSQVVWPASMAKEAPLFYDVSATFTVGTPKREMLLMWQNLLRDRFGLLAHRESGARPVYAISVSPDGLRIQASTDSQNNSITFAGSASGAAITPTAFILNGNMPIARLVNSFSGHLDLPLVDLTGLRGEYHIHLTIPRESVRPNSNVPFTQYTPEMFEAIDGWHTDDFIRAMKTQLGLQVAKRNVPRDVLVIDRTKTVPTAN